MDGHEEFVELCAAAVAHELSGDEQERLKAHLETCEKCRAVLKDYDTLLMRSIPAIAPEMASDDPAGAADWSLADAERRLFQKIDSERGEATSSKVRESQDSVGKRYSYRPSQIRWREVWMTFAAAVILAAALAVTLYKTGLRRGIDSAQVPTSPSPERVNSLEAQVSDAGYEREQLRGKLVESEKVIADLRRRLEEQGLAIQSLQKTAGSESKAQNEGEATDSRQSAELKAAQARLAELQRDLDAENGKRQEAASQVAVLEKKVKDLSQLAQEREESLDRKEEQVADQQELLDHDRDIRELMGARELYMADVHDVSNEGTSKTYGRIFYTKGKSLIFYAFDLQERAGLRNASAYQVWGRRGPDKKNARSLGIFYEDNASKKRWVMKANDPKSLQDIDAVFVTVEPNGGSAHPSSKPLLFAYLGVTPNHP